MEAKSERRLWNIREDSQIISCTGCPKDCEDGDCIVRRDKRCCRGGNCLAEDPAADADVDETGESESTRYPEDWTLSEMEIITLAHPFLY